MTAADFSNLVLRPEVLANTLARGYHVTDETWLGTVHRIDPPLFSDGELHDLTHILDPSVERRGRKSLASLSEPLVARLRQLERADLPDRFVAGLIERLGSGNRYTRADSDREYGKRWQKFERDRLIVYFYDYIYDRIESQGGTIKHEVFETISISERGRTKSERALATLHDFLVDRTVINPPSEGTILRIVSEASGRKRRRKT
ncbi:MAG: hypothetical protein AAF251_11945 [Pseudomonadota bacterium]